MKKAIIFSLTLALVFTMSGAAVLAETNVSTGLTQDTSGGANPIVKVKWEANIDRYTDDSSVAGAQFMPSGQKDVNKVISICAIATDPDGLEDVINVYADVFYPEDIALGEHHEKLDDQSGLGCGALMQEDELTKLGKAEGISLFCDQVRNNNNDLPTFAYGYDYDEICKLDGELQKETAAVYCAEKDLSYEDPSGDYIVWAVAQDKVGLQDILPNSFEYLPLTAFETDFTSIEYGSVRLNTHKIINGDLTWDALDQGLASVRNVGNTRLEMSVWQDDMGFGKTNGNWNVRYDARVGSDGAWAYYDPEETTVLDMPLDLSELDEMDFSIEVSKFPPTHTGPYEGEMVLTASSVDHLTCDGRPTPQWRTISLENKTDQWVIISDDQTKGDIDYWHNDTTFHGVVDGIGLTPNAKYQISLTGQGTCTPTDHQLAAGPGNLFSSGYWNGGPSLSATCGTPGQGVHNMDLVTDWYTFIADGSGNFSHPFDIALPPGDYIDVKVIVKRMLDPYVSPWVDEGTGWPTFNLFEVASISFTIVP